MVYKQPGPNLRQRSAGRLPTMRIKSWCPSTSTSDLVCACGSTRSFFNIQERWSSSTSGTYHWVQSNGFATNISWNTMFDDVTQLATAAIFSDQNVKHKYDTVLPIEKLIWEAVRTQRNAGTDFSKVAKRMLTCSLAHCQLEYEAAIRHNWEIGDASECPMGELVCFNKLCFKGGSSTFTL
ncbi:unnamed protein product [Caenorhabditis brenneri]